MKHYIQYYDFGVMSNELIPVCGDRGIISLDNRMNRENMLLVGQRENGVHRPKYAAMELIAGNNLLEAKPISDIILL